MSLKDQFSVDVINCFLNTAEFAEVITYAPEGGAAKDINAIVVRGRLEPGSEDQGRGLQNQAGDLYCQRCHGRRYIGR